MRATPEQATRAFNAGFTLMELLIAMVILSIIMVLLFSGLRLGSRAWESVETVSDQTAELRIARNFIERCLRQTRQANLTVDGEQIMVFSGFVDRLEFVAPLLSHVGIPGLYVLRLTLEEGAHGNQRLMLTRWLLHPDVLIGTDESPAWEPLQETSALTPSDDSLERDLAGGAWGRTMLLEEVGEFSLAYFGVPEGELDPQWRDDWIGQTRLPSRVRLDLTTADQRWPLALIALPGAAVTDATP